MTLPASGAISFNAINVELGVAGTTSANINQASYRTLAGVPSGTISLASFYGKSDTFSFTISTDTTNANLRSLALAAGWGGSAQVIATINSGVFVYSTSTGTPALTINGSFPNGVTLTNDGTIQGQGGAAGAGGGSGGDFNGSNGAAGGLALSVSVAVTLTNNTRIAGGGGGGGGGGAYELTLKTGAEIYGAGGGGGGLGGNGGAGGARGLGNAPYNYHGTAGTAGTQATVGTGGNNPFIGGGLCIGGNGGSYGAAGAAGAAGTLPPGTGGTGGAAGGCITGNANITYLATGTRNGGIS
jgi:hypothetical protein